MKVINKIGQPVILSYDQLVDGKTYICHDSDVSAFYHGWVLVANRLILEDDVILYGFWLNEQHPTALLASSSINKNRLQFTEVKATLTVERL